MNKKYRKILIISVCSVAAVAVCITVLIAVCNCFIASYNQYVLPIEALPKCHTALVPGCSPKVNGRFTNRYFKTRIIKAAELYHSGKVKTLLLSGDNGRKSYNEPQEMRKALIALHVPDDAIYCDYAGFRTLDSMVRAECIFGQRKFIVVSQTFHCERAIAIGRNIGIECYGFASDVPALSWKWTLRRVVREYAARVAAVMDIVLKTQPKFYGVQIDMSVPQKKDPELP